MLNSLRARPINVFLTAIALSLFATTVGTAAPAAAALAAVPRATCGASDHPETDLQGEVSAEKRVYVPGDPAHPGFQGFNCNLELIGQVKGDGANWQTTQFSTGQSLRCAYHGTAVSDVNRTHVGVPVIDITDPNAPSAQGYLTTIAMLDPWESLKVNERRKLLAATDAHNGGFGAGGPEVDVYDLSQDCRSPQLLASVAIGTGTDGGIPAPAVPQGHEGAWAPDGLTYYFGDNLHQTYHAIDMTDPTHPKRIAAFDMKTLGLASHGLSVSDDGNRAYVVAPFIPANLADITNPAVPAKNGFVILDTSQVQARLPNAQIKVVSTFLFKDGSVAQHTIPVKINGRPYVIHVDEGGSGGIFPAGWAFACANNLPVFPMPRIVDISDETQPKEVSKIMLETHLPANCGSTLLDIAGLAIFTYGSHYCSVDNKHHATTLACGFFNSGIRIFDIRDPVHPKEIAYYNPAGTTTPSPGSNHVTIFQWRAGGPDWCSAQVHLDHTTGTVWSTCQDNGMLMLKFTNGVWPFPGSSTPPGEQN